MTSTPPSDAHASRGRVASGVDAATMARLRRLELTITRRIDGLLWGDHRGLFPGPGSEPAGARPYEVGDDPRRIDWSLTARTSVPHVRQTEADRELETWLVVDASASLDVGTAHAEKRELALAAAATVALLTARDGNRVGAIVCGGRRQVRVPARSGLTHVRAILRTIALQHRHEVAPGSGADLAASLVVADRLAKRRGLVAVVSDFLDPPATWERPLGRLAARHHLLATRVTDPAERRLPDIGLVRFVDPESGREVEVQTSAPEVRARYAEAAAARDRAIDTALRRAHAHSTTLSTDRDWVLDLVRSVLAGRTRDAAPPVLAKATA